MSPPISISPPSRPPRKLPAILYVCGHGAEKKDGISYGNKVHYQLSRRVVRAGQYACLMVDSLQLGEIEALHHGTYREGMWWWNARSYTPAGVEHGAACAPWIPRVAPRDRRRASA
ncbi:MAG: hypothetical protein R3F11_12120 [Verrucomicrobiales bacterium]